MKHVKPQIVIGCDFQEHFEFDQTIFSTPNTHK